MPNVHIAWLPKACRNAAVRKEVAEAVIKAMCSVKSAQVDPKNLVVRFSESVGEASCPLFFCPPLLSPCLPEWHSLRAASLPDGFPLPKGFSENPELQAPQK